MTTISAASTARGPPALKLHSCKSPKSDLWKTPSTRPPRAAVFHARAMRAHSIQTAR